jgi:hypothetical protein
MLRRSLPTALFLVALGATTAPAQVRLDPALRGVSVPRVELPALAASHPARVGLRRSALLRTAATLAASAAAFHFAYESSDRDPDELRTPIASGAVGAALAGLVFSDAPAGRVIGGSILATLPAGALAAYAAGLLDDDEQGRIPLVAFAIPHGLLTSGFAQNRSRR